jgi:hypothetical protein
MKIRTTDDFNVITGSSLKGYLTADYKELVALFGKPHEGDGYKVQAEWIVILSDETGEEYVASIYDWKQGAAYWGNDGMGVPPEHVTEWHVGSRSHHGATLLKEYIDKRREEAIEQAWAAYATHGLEAWDMAWLEEGL